MDLKKIAMEAKELVDERGGTDGLKEDLDELKGIAGGSLADKAKEAVEAVKDPGEDAAAGQPAVRQGPAGKPRPGKQERQGQHRGGEHHRRHQAR